MLRHRGADTAAAQALLVSHLLGCGADVCICDVSLENTLPRRRLTCGEFAVAASNDVLVSQLLLESHRRTPHRVLAANITCNHQQLASWQLQFTQHAHTTIQRLSSYHHMALYKFDYYY